MPPTNIELELIKLIRANWFGPDEGESGLADIDWPALLTAASHHGLAPLLFASLKQHAQAAQVPAGIRETLRLAYVRTSVGNQLAFQELASWVDYCGREKIPLIVLKGGALAQTLYPDSALRPMGDLDLLIPPGAGAQVERALVEQGFAAPLEVAHGFADRFYVERSFVRAGPRPAQIDLHWHAFTMPYYAERIPIEWFWHRTVEFTVNGWAAQTFSPTAQLLYLSAHSAMHHYRRLIWSFDLALLLANEGDRIDWDEAIEAATRFGLTPNLRQTLDEIRSWWGIPLPAEAERLFTRAMPLKDRLMFAISRSDSPLPSELSLRGAKNKLSYAWGRIFPSPKYMQKRYRFRSRALLPLSYVWRAAKGSYLMARASLFIVLSTGRAHLRRNVAS